MWLTFCKKIQYILQVLVKIFFIKYRPKDCLILNGKKCCIKKTKYHIVSFKIYKLYKIDLTATCIPPHIQKQFAAYK